MLDQLIKLVKDNAGDAIVNNPAIPNQYNDEAIKETAGGIMESLKQHAGSGGVAGIMDMFSGKGSDDMKGKITQDVTSKLAGKFGLDSGSAGNIVKMLIPVVLAQLAKKTNDPNDSSFSMDGILSSIGGGKAGDLLNSVKGMFGK